jgi:hypothetical protein
VIAALLVACAALAQGGGEPQGVPPGQDEPKLAPKTPIAGLVGFRSRSRVVVRADPEQVLLLEAFYVFPERVRWSLLPEGAAATQRLLYFRLGAESWSIAPGETASKRLGSEAGDSAWQGTDVHMELRRAAMLWPDGFTWRGEGSSRTAESSLRSLAFSAKEPGSIGFLAKLDDAGRPKELHVLAGSEENGPGGETGMALLDIAWKQQGERWWPSSFRLVGYSDHEWHETVESIDTAVNALDDFFVPPDRRKVLAGAESTQPQVVALPPAIQSRRPLPEGASWDEALALAEKWSSEEAARLAERGAKLQDGLVLELSAETGLPAAVLLRLGGAMEPLPEGWERIAERSGVSARRNGPPPVSKAALDRLAQQLPADAVAAAPYVRIAKRPSGEPTLQVVLPFVRPH